MINPKLNQIATLQFFNPYNLCLYGGKNEIYALRQPEIDVKKWLSQGLIRVLEDFREHGRGKKQGVIYACTKQLYKNIDRADEYRYQRVKTQQLMHDLMLRDVAMWIMRTFPEDRLEFNYKLKREETKIIDLYWVHKGMRYCIEVENKQNPSTDTLNKAKEFNKITLPRHTKVLFLVGMLTYDGYARKQTIELFKNNKYVKDAKAHVEKYKDSQPYSFSGIERSKIYAMRTFVRRYEGWEKLNKNYKTLLENLKDLPPVKKSKGTNYHYKLFTTIDNFYRLDEKVFNIPGVEGKTKLFK